MALVIAAIVLLLFAVTIGLMFWLVFSAWFHWIEPAFWTLGVTGGVSATFWVLSFIIPRAINRRWRRVFMIAFGASCVGFLVFLGTIFGGSALIDVIPEDDMPIHAKPCAPDCKWWHTLWDDNMWLQSGKYNSG